MRTVPGDGLGDFRDTCKGKVPSRGLTFGWQKWDQYPASGLRTSLLSEQFPTPRSGDALLPNASLTIG